MVYFTKFDPRQKVYLSDGSYLQFEDLGNGWGVMVTENTYTVRQLRECIANQRGGVSEVTEGEYEAVKKKEPMTSFGTSFQEVIDLRNLSRIFKKLSEGGVVEDKGQFHSDTNFRREDIARPVGKTGYRPMAVAR